MNTGSKAGVQSDRRLLRSSLPILYQTLILCASVCYWNVIGDKVRLSNELKEFGLLNIPFRIINFTDEQVSLCRFKAGCCHYLAPYKCTTRHQDFE